VKALLSAASDIAGHERLVDDAGWKDAAPLLVQAWEALGAAL
jgi:hypothetical protein